MGDEDEESNYILGACAALPSRSLVMRLENNVVEDRRSYQKASFYVSLIKVLTDAGLDRHLHQSQLSLTSSDPPTRK